MAEAHASRGKTVKDVVGNAWMNSMTQRFLHSGDEPQHEKHLIYRVHSVLRKQNMSAYEPIIISIGPYHRGKEHLQSMETHKQRYLRHLLSRNSDISFEYLVEMMQEQEERVRRCYPEKTNLPRNEFVEMMLLDGCFIVELFLKYKYGHDNDDLMVGPAWRFDKLISYDLLLLENQLPFFILQDIFQIMQPNEGDPLAFVNLSLDCLKESLELLDPTTPLNYPGHVYHLLHLLHTHLLPNLTTQPEKSKTPRLQTLVPCLGMFSCQTSLTSKQRKKWWMPSAVALEEAGIKFKVGSNNLLDIKFCNGVMKIPSIYVYDKTEIRLRNLIAFEQCCLSPSHYYFTSYIAFMDYIINTSKDVEVLHKNCILTHGLGNDDEVACMFNKLCNEVMVDYEENYLSHMVKKVNEYSNSRIHKWRASLARDYFYSPWAVLSFIAALLILSLTATQTIFSILSYGDARQP